MAMLAKIALVQFFFFDLILACCCKGVEVAGCTLDPSVLHVVIVAENYRVGTGGAEGHITAAGDREDRAGKQADQEYAEHGLHSH